MFIEYIPVNLLMFSGPMGFWGQVLHVLQQLVRGLLSISSVKAKPSDYQSYAQPAIVNPIVHSANRQQRKRVYVLSGRK